MWIMVIKKNYIQKPRLVCIGDIGQCVGQLEAGVCWR